LPQQYDITGFFEIAIELAADPSDEMRLRTAIGRAYYAAFLLARKAVGREWDDTPGCHTAVQHDIRRANIQEKLRTMHRLRKAADYEEVPQRPDQRNWVENWRRAHILYNQIAPEFEKYIREGRQ
jgi:hypothetical protein